jgi:hypothetical protein
VGSQAWEGGMSAIATGKPYTKDEIILGLVACLDSLHLYMNDFKKCEDPECTICDLIRHAKEQIGK